jgi:hypothetical protein
VAQTEEFRQFHLTPSQRAQQMATVALKREELQNIKAMMNAALLNLPEVAVDLDLWNANVDFAKCRTMEERWRQITGTQLPVDSDGQTAHFRSVTALLFASTVTRFIVNDFPVTAMTRNGVELSSHPNTITKVNGEITNLQWTSAGLICDVKLYCDSPMETFLTTKTPIPYQTILREKRAFQIPCTSEQILYGPLLPFRI